MTGVGSGSWPEASGFGPLVKVCGIRTVADARMCVDLGVDAIGLNFWPGTKRRVEVDEAVRIVSAVGAQIATVGLFVDEDRGTIEQIRREVGFAWVQLHGRESPDDVEALGPQAYKALRVGAVPVDADAARYPGALLLLDALVPGEVGGTGRRFDWSLAQGLAQTRPIVLAGGLTPDNVARAARAVGPRAVDVASGVESEPGVKDPRLVEAFVAAARVAV
ncbi:MAG: phosphoribosylanthranilate isomerase [Deltaproteobacteria bacterium]|nr:phosphoribosylanthranilate isomerase [Deltaproteobacteria bacterium]